MTPYSSAGDVSAAASGWDLYLGLRKRCHSNISVFHCTICLPICLQMFTQGNIRESDSHEDTPVMIIGALLCIFQDTLQLHHTL